MGSVLNNYGLNELHMVDFKRRFLRTKSKYRRINKPDGERLIDQLTDVITGRVMIGVADGVPMDAYNQVVKGKYEISLGRK